MQDSSITTNRVADAKTAVRRLMAIVGFAAVVPAVLMMAPAIAGQLGRQYGWAPGQIGLLFSVELGGMSLASLPAYYWQDRFAWPKVARLAIVLFIIANVLSTQVEHYYSLMVWRFISALAGGTLMVLCLTSAGRMENAARAYGWWLLGQLLLGAAGLWVLPYLFKPFGIAACYVLLAGLMVLLSPFSAYFIEQAPAPSPRSAPERGQPLLWQSWVGIVGLFLFYVCLSGVWAFSEGIATQMGVEPEKLGWILAIATLFGVLGAGVATWIGQRVARRRSLFWGYVVMLLSILSLLALPSLWRYSLAVFAFKAMWTFVLPFILATLASIDLSGRLINTSNLVIGGGLALGPALAGFLIQASGGTFDNMLLLSAVLCALSLALLLSLQRRTGNRMDGSNMKVALERIK